MMQLLLTRCNTDRYKVPTYISNMHLWGEAGSWLRGQQGFEIRQYFKLLKSELAESQVQYSA